MLEHGGRLRRAAARYGISLADWLDLSTGINPNGWPVRARALRSRTPRVATIHERLARQGVLTRMFDDPPSLRLGLPGNESQWRRLESVLTDLSATAPVKTPS